ncbi:WD40 repeat domain-containing protein [Nostoc sp.]|uniref:WD40 repeat domain-containing protein n=1 Tax=Nostoc sp. TaxID=1180 RepID=UPI002FF7F29A
MNVKLWKHKGEVLQTLIGLDAGVKSLSFNPNGQVLASSDSVGKVTLWNLEFDSNPEKLLAQTCNCVRDYLQDSADVKEEERGLCVSVARRKHRISTVKVSL